MKTNAKSVQVFEIRAWSRKYFRRILKPRDSVNIYDGFMTDAKSKKKIHFHTPAQLMKAFEKLYSEAEK